MSHYSVSKQEANVHILTPCNGDISNPVLKSCRLNSNTTQNWKAV